ncbi:MAG TPA: ABC transporter permease [Candidatus Acidoferrales bacterium]|nr:ABC transporter permease [Candidatus Acidoferrales bacterium]
MIRHMILRNTLHRPVRTLISILAVAIEVALVILVVGLVTGLLTESAKRTQGVGADIMVQPPSASMLMAFSGAPMPISIAKRLQRLDYVQAVAPVLLQFNSIQGLEIVYGIDPASFRSVSGGFVYLEGHGLENADDILVDDVYARARKVKVGQTVRLFGDHDFRVAGIVEHGKGARLFVLLSALQDLAGAKSKASIFYVKCDRSDHTAAAMSEMEQLLPSYQVRALKDFTSLMTSTNLPGLNAFISVMIGIAVAIGFLVIFLAMYTTIVERTREIGVLKSLGASKSYIIEIILSETTLLCLGGIVVGVAISYGARTAFMQLFPTLTIEILPKWVLYAALIAIGGGLLGASYPAWLASRKDPVEALSYE